MTFSFKDSKTITEENSDESANTNANATANIISNNVKTDEATLRKKKTTRIIIDIVLTLGIGYLYYIAWIIAFLSGLAAGGDDRYEPIVLSDEIGLILIFNIGTVIQLLLANVYFFFAKTRIQWLPIAFFVCVLLAAAFGFRHELETPLFTAMFESCFPGLDHTASLFAEAGVIAYNSFIRYLVSIVLPVILSLIIPIVRLVKYFRKKRLKINN
jgi:hypothetical protein